jgi:predicted DNA-binding transcriptional regulator AlpA
MDTRSTSESPPVAPTIIRAPQDLRLPRWVNEPLPDLRAILSASEISRLTRRPRWLLLGLAVLGRFPKQRTHCGKPVGWHRADVLDWLTQHMRIEPDLPSTPRTCRQARPRQACLPLEIRTSCGVRGGIQRRRSTHGEQS